MKSQLELEVQSLMAALTDEANWDDFKRALSVFERINQGIGDLDAQRSFTTEALRDHFRKKTRTLELGPMKSEPVKSEPTKVEP
jgi:hypothetical protein